MGISRNCIAEYSSVVCRKDMAALDHRAATLDLSEGCARCGVAVGEPPPATAGISGGAVPPFYLFPSGNAFHCTCLASEVMQLVPPAQQQRIHTLLTRLSQVAKLSFAAASLVLCSIGLMHQPTVHVGYCNCSC